jgi:hypothetical protein
MENSEFNSCHQHSTNSVDRNILSRTISHLSPHGLCNMEDQIEKNKANDSAAEARAAAIAVLKRAEERDQQRNLTTPPASPITMPITNKRSSRESSSSATLMQSFKEHLRGDFQSIKSKIHEIDDKLLEKQMEQEEKIRQRISKSTAELAEMLSPKKKKSITDKTTPRKSTGFREMVIEDMNAARDEVQSAINKAKSKIQGTTLTSTTAAETLKANYKKKQVNGDEKIINDLQLVHEQMTLCHSLMADRSRDDQVLLKVIGFLEACLERMEHVTAAGSNGFLQEETTQICLSTYQRLVLTLEICDSPLVASNAFSKSLEGDDEFDEPSPDVSFTKFLEGDDEFDEPSPGVPLAKFLESDDEFDEPSPDVPLTKFLGDDDDFVEPPAEMKEHVSSDDDDLIEDLFE